MVITTAELKELIQLLQDHDYPTLHKRFIEFMAGVELCNHLEVDPCWKCLEVLGERHHDRQIFAGPQRW